jgi:phosphomannomutase
LPIVSLSGIRGIVNQDIDASYALSVGLKFGNFTGRGSVAIAADTRSTSEMIKGATIAGLLQSGCTVSDLGYSSTPSVFKEVMMRRLDGGLIITASHNPPEWNGIKFVLKGGRGVFENELDEIRNCEPVVAAKSGRMFTKKPIYVEILRFRAGKDSAKGVKVALDMAGGVGSLFVPSLISFQGCEVHSMHDTPGIFPRIIDPTSDPLLSLSNEVKESNCQVGLAFDCDADRLVIVDEEGRKLSGDATLLLCLNYFLENARNRRVAVSVDTSLAAEDLVREYNGETIYSKVGEANVVRKILENNCGAGGEGSSGGYIEPGFVMCRDGVYASTMITRMIKAEGSLKQLISNFKSYFQERRKFDFDRNHVSSVLSALANSESEVELTDGIKIRKNDRSWVLIRYSNTENVIRVSAEADSTARAKNLVEEYARRIKEIEAEERQH